jgi:cell wall-associated NlpC family hydrolase
VVDTDKDGLSDEFERRTGTDPFDKDSDNDGLMDGAELRFGTKPRDRDSDGDGYNDGNEIGAHHDPLHADPPPQNAHLLPNGGRDREQVPTADDPDADGLVADHEQLIGTNPDEPDSDGDGLGDWVEFLRGTKPTSKFSGGPGDKTSDLDDVVAEFKAGRGAAPKGGVAPAPAGPSTAAPGASAPGTTTPQGAIDPGVVLTGDTAIATFLDAAEAQIGDKYRFGAETKLDDPNPTAFDSSELVQWAAAQAGVKLPDGSWNQYRHLAAQGRTIPMDHALRTPGALVFGFSSDPMASTGRPARAYVGISLGDGTILDVSERSGEVKIMEPGNFYTYAATIPELMQDFDSDGDGISDDKERDAESDPFDPTIDKGYPIPADTLPEPDDSDPPVEDETEVPPSEEPTEQSPTGETTDQTEQTEPTGEQTEPTGEQTDPTGEQTEPTGEESSATVAAVPELMAEAAIDTTTEQVDPVDSIDTTAYDVPSSYDDGSSYESSSYEPASDDAFA